MWFQLAFITFLSFGILCWLQHYASRWKGQNSQTNGKTSTLSYQYKLTKSKDKIVGFKIGIIDDASAKYAYDFTLKEEGFFDRLFKKIGLSVEIQLGLESFDNKIYIISDNKTLWQQLTKEKALFTKLTELFPEIEEDQPLPLYLLNTINVRPGRLWLDYGVYDSVTESDVIAVANTTVPLLEQLKTALKKASNNTPNKKIKGLSFFSQAAMVLAISASLVVYGVFTLVFTSSKLIPFTIDVSQLLTHTALLSSFVLIIACLLVFLIFGRTSRAHLVLASLLTIGLFGVATSIGGNLNALNRNNDTSPISQIIVNVQSKETRRASASRTDIYFITVNDWIKTNELREIRVSRYLFDQTQEGSQLNIRQRSGRLNYRWVENIEVVDG